MKEKEANDLKNLYELILKTIDENNYGFPFILTLISMLSLYNVEWMALDKEDWRTFLCTLNNQYLNFIKKDEHSL